METLYLIIPILLGLFISNFRPVWNNVKPFIDSLHVLGHKLFGIFGGKWATVTRRVNKKGEKELGHDVNIKSKFGQVASLLMGAPTPVILGTLVVLVSFTLDGPLILSSLILLFGVVLISGGVNGLLDITFFTPRGSFTDASRLEEVTTVDSRKWVLLSWAVSLVVPITMCVIYFLVM